MPVIAANIQTAPNSPAVASIQVPPLPEGTEFLPRTLVHLFFHDGYAEQSPLISYRGASARKASQDPTLYEQGVERALEGEDADTEAIDKLREARKYRLIFGGEVVGFQWTKSPMNRSLVLQCQDWSNYWDYAYQWNNTDLFGPGLKALFSGGSTNLFTDFLSDEGSVLMQILRQPSPQYPGLKGLLGGIVHLLEAIGGSYYYGKQFAGQNSFFSIAELRLHITQMITTYENDPTAYRLLNADGYDGLFGRTLGNLGSQVSIRQAINSLLPIIFHETYAIPSPMFVPGTGGSINGAFEGPLKKHPLFKASANTASTLAEAVRTMRASIASKAKENQNGGLGPASRVFGAGVQAEVLRAKKAGTTLTDPAVKPVAALFQGAAGHLVRARAILPNLSTKFPQARLDSVLTEMDRAAEKLEKIPTFVVKKKGAKAVPARLNSQILRPDVWFSAPPRCNVLFPEQYMQLSYARSFLQEPTRLLLKTNDEFFGEDELFDSFFFAPKALTVKGNKRNLQALLENDVLDHELFTGILPVFEKMGELNIFSARSGTSDSTLAKVGLAQRTTNFLYFKYRFAARQMSITARFNPYLVPGFPGLVIDKYVDMASLKRRQELLQQYGKVTLDADRMMGTHFLGNFTQVSHSIDQSGGRTEIACSYPRQPTEGVEFLGAVEKDQTVKKRFDKDALRTTVVASLNPPRIYSLGPNYGNITAVEDVTDTYAWDENGGIFPVFQGPRRKGTGEPTIYAPVGVAKRAKDYDNPDIVKLVGNPNQVVAFKAYRISEEVPRYRKEVVDIPAEELIRPGWYGDCWHPSKVGEVYQSFFGTGAITDPQQVADPAGASVGVMSQDATDALLEAANGIDYEDPRTTAPAILTLDKGSSIQSSVAFLVQVYSYIRQGGIDVDEFIRAYTWRPIATMVDMFGTSDLAYSKDGATILKGIEGFHSRAFGPYENLFGLVASDIESVLGVKRGSTVAHKFDTRKRKQDAVLAYVQAISFGRAILG